MNPNHDELGRFASGPSLAGAKLGTKAAKIRAKEAEEKAIFARQRLTPSDQVRFGEGETIKFRPKAGSQGGAGRSPKPIRVGEKVQQAGSGYQGIVIGVRETLSNSAGVDYLVSGSVYGGGKVRHVVSAMPHHQLVKISGR